MVLAAFTGAKRPQVLRHLIPKYLRLYLEASRRIELLYTDLQYWTAQPLTNGDGPYRTLITI